MKKCNKLCYYTLYHKFSDSSQALELMEAVAAPTGQAGHAELVAAGVAKAEAAGGDGKLDLIFLQGVVPPCHTEVVFSEMTAGEGP